MRVPAPLCWLWLGLVAVRSLPAGDPPTPHEASSTAASAVSPITAEAARAVQEVLGSGFRARPDASVITRLASAGETGPQDSRIDYARGLALLKHLKLREAIVALERAAPASPPYLPAWQALIRTSLLLNDADSALRHAETLAAQLADAGISWPDEACREQGAEWLGRVAGYLALTGADLVERPILLNAHEARVRLALDESLMPAWQRGRDSIHREHQQLLQERAAARTEIAARQEQEHKARAAEIETQKADLDKQGETLQMTSREWQAWLDDVFRRTEKQLGVLQKDYAVLDTAAREISGEILSARGEMAALQLLPDVRGSDPSGQPAPSPRTFAAAELEGRIVRLQIQFNALAAKASTVSGHARRLLTERTTAVRRFERATGKIARQDATLQKWEKLLEKSAAKAETTPVTQTSQYRSLTNRLTQVATYFELDLDRERQRLLAETTTPP